MIAAAWIGAAICLVSALRLFWIAYHEIEDLKW